MEQHPESALWKVGSLDAVDGKTAFSMASTDPIARDVVEHYVEMLGTGIVNLANEFRPEAIILGGGVCAEGEALLRPLEAFLAREVFAGEKGPAVKLVIATLGNSAGILGASALWL
jgi:glucokinase